MKYIVECRKKDSNGNITGICYRGFGNGLPNKKIADTIYYREVSTNQWGAVYMDKISANGYIDEVKSWESVNI